MKENGKEKVKLKDIQELRASYGECQLSDTDKNRVYRDICEMMLVYAIREGDIEFFDKKNPMKDVVFGVLDLPEEKAKEKTLERRHKLKEAITIKNREFWTEERIKKLFDGTMTVEEIALITDYSQGMIYRFAKMNPDWKFKKTKGANRKTAPRMELIEMWRSQSV